MRSHTETKTKERHERLQAAFNEIKTFITWIWLPSPIWIIAIFLGIIIHTPLQYAYNVFYTEKIPNWLFALSTYTLLALIFAVSGYIAKGYRQKTNRPI